MLFRDYFFPFEVTSILLIVAAIATMVLAQRRVRAVTQAELVAHRRGWSGATLVRTPIAYFLLLAAVLFAIGTVGVLVNATRCASSCRSSCS